MQFETAILSTITHDEARDLARAEEKVEEDQTDSLLRQYGDSFSGIVVSNSRTFFTFFVFVCVMETIL